MEEQAKKTARNLRELGFDEEFIAKAVNVEAALIRQWFAEEAEA